MQTSRGGTVKGPSHENGGVKFVLDTGKVIEEEGKEVNIPAELLESDQIFTFYGTNKQVLDKILNLASLSISDKVTDVRAGDIVICVRSVEDDTKRKFVGTIEEILHQVNTSKGCKPIIKEEVTARNGGPINPKWRKKDMQAEDPNSERWQKKKQAIHELSNNAHRLRLNVTRDLSSDDERTTLTALIVAIMDRSGERVGNDDSADNGHFGVTGFLKKHVHVIGNKIHLDYVGKSGTKHEKSFSDERIAKALKKAIKNAPGKFIFETSDGFRIKSDKVNRYLEPFNISAKDLRGYNANRWIIERLKNAKVENSENINKLRKQRKKIFNQALKDVALRVGHGKGTLRKHYMIPELPNEYIENGTIIDMKNLGYYQEGSKIENSNNMEKFKFKKGELAPAYANTLQELSGIGSDLWKHKFKDELKFRKALEKLSNIYFDNIRELNEQFVDGGMINSRRSFNENDFDNVEESNKFRILKDATGFTIYDKDSNEFLGRWNKSKQVLGIFGRTLNNPLVKWLDEQGYTQPGEHKRLDDGGTTEEQALDDEKVNHLCFSTYLKNEDPILIEELMDNDVNLNPAVREKVNEAYKAWNGGKM